MGKYISEDALTEMCVEGIKSHLQTELKTRLMGELEAEIDLIVASAMARFEGRAYEFLDMSGFDRKIKIELLFLNKAKEKSGE